MMKFSGVVFGLGLALVASTAEAGNFTADCSGWSDTGDWDVPHPADIVATATLEQWDGTNWIPVQTSVDTVSLAPFSPFDTNGTWSGTLSGTYRASIDWAATVIYSPESKEVWNFYGEFGPFDCAPPSSNAARTPGYWKNHPENWPVSSLTVGGQSYSQACLLAFFDLPTQGDARIKLIHHLVAAKLNLLPNSVPGLGSTDPSIQPTIDAADAFLISIGTTINCGSNSLNGSLSKSQKNTATGLKDTLDAYNNNIGSGSSSLTADEQGGCTAMNAESSLIVFALPLLALFVLRRRRD